MKNNWKKVLIFAIFINMLWINKLQSQYNEVIQSIDSYCYEPYCPPSLAIDGDHNTCFVVHPYVSCSGSLDIFLNITLKRSIKAASIRIISDAPGIALEVGSLYNYHKTIQKDETVFIVKPDQFQQILLTRPGLGSVCEIIIEELMIDDISMPYQYDNGGKMINRTFVLGPVTRSSMASAPAMETPEDVVFFEDVIDMQKVVIYPNPTRNEIKIDFGNMLPLDQTGLAEIYNMSGAKIATADINNNSALFDLSAQPSGTYILIITVNDKQSHWRVIKE
jgi:hypothetical protein